MVKFSYKSNFGEEFVLAHIEGAVYHEWEVKATGVSDSGSHYPGSQRRRMDANFSSVPFLHLYSPESQSGNDTAHRQQVFSLQDSPTQPQPKALHPGYSRFTELTAPAITLGLCPTLVCTCSKREQASLHKGSVLHSPMNYGLVTLRCVSYVKKRKCTKIISSSPPLG